MLIYLTQLLMSYKVKNYAQFKNLILANNILNYIVLAHKIINVKLDQKW